MIHPKRFVPYILAGTWIVFFLVEGASSLVRGWYTRKMKTPVREFYRLLVKTKSLTLFAALGANIFLLISALRRSCREER